MKQIINNIFKKYLIVFMALSIGATSCYDLDLDPLAEGSSNNWFTTQTEVQMSIDELYRGVFWQMDKEVWTDYYVNRKTNSSIVNGTLNSEDSEVASFWEVKYKGVVRANIILENMDKARSNGMPDNFIKQVTGEAYFMRATMYANLVTHFGDIPFYTESVDLETLYQMKRTPKEEIYPKIYEDYDKAIELLSTTPSSSGIRRATKGAALALKARFALYIGDWTVAAESAKECIDLDVYSLHPNFSHLFLASTRNSKESIFLTPRSLEHGSSLGSTAYVLNWLPRNAGGYASRFPSWDLLACFLCTDGKPIDESPIFNPRNPFENRDPRCAATIVEFGSRHVGFTYDPHPQASKVMNFTTGEMVKNKDSRAQDQYASYNALLWKKGVDDSWLAVNGFDADPDNIVIRYADVLLMYAEAKVEMGEVDQSVLDAINQVRARAYEADYTNTSLYPAVTDTDPIKLRRIIRTERNMEFANEGLRYMDLIRWRLAEKVLSIKNYGILHPASKIMENVVNKGLWFWPSTPQIDEDGVPDFTAMEDAKQIDVLAQRKWDNRQYLWPIPSTEILINKNLVQNPGY